MMRFYYWLLLATTLLSSCVGQPSGVTPVTPFELNRYLGKWYEVARLDHSFEEGLSQVTAHYRLKDDGSIEVINRGYNAKKNQWDEAEGKAKFAEDATTAFFKVSFFGPFYSSYIVFELDEQYQYAFVSGPNTDYLWLLSRQPQVPDALKQRFERRAQALGFDTSALIYPNHKTP
jgi:apolipoprotein D and lipocalin family protein